jgi:hypothetical protein
VIVVATADFELYHEAVTALRERGLDFTTVDPDEALPAATEAVLTGAGDDVTVDGEIPVVRADPAEPRAAVEALLARLRGEAGRRVVGIDPGDRPGIAVLVGDTVVATYQVPESQVGAVVADEIESAADPLVRIGDGARLVGSRILDDLPDVPVELVDETGTTPYIGRGARGMGDVLAAVNIARRSGEPVDARDVEPTAGELRRIKERSREASQANRAIDDDLARRVAAGQLTVREALTEHRSDG